MHVLLLLLLLLAVVAAVVVVVLVLEKQQPLKCFFAKNPAASGFLRLSQTMVESMCVGSLPCPVCGASSCIPGVWG